MLKFKIMYLSVILLIVLSFITGFVAANLQNIQKPTTLNIDLSNPSLPNNVMGLSEVSYGGYRPLYPPYFLRDAPNAHLPEQIYYDKAYYSRGRQLQEERFHRALGSVQPTLPLLTPQIIASMFIPAAAVHQVIQHPANEVAWTTNMANRHGRTEIANVASFLVKSSCNYRALGYTY